MNHRSVLHIGVADFHIAVEHVLEPGLRGRPVAIAVETASRSLVYACSRQARECGVYHGQPLIHAMKRCRDLTVLAPNTALYARATRALVRVLGQFSPVIEPLSCGHAYLDMTGCGGCFGGIKDAAARAQREIRDRLRLDTMAGIAGNKLVSKVASDVVAFEGDAHGLCTVDRGQESVFLAPLQVHFLPGVSPPVQSQLFSLNIRLIRELALISEENLQMVFGRFGLVLYQRARGIDTRPVQPPKRAPEIAEAQTLDQDSNDYHECRHILFKIFYRAARRLRQKNMLCGRLAVTVYYSDQVSNREHCRFPASDNEKFLIEKLSFLFEKAQNRRVRVRRLELCLNQLVPQPEQLSLFGPEKDPKNQALVAAMDKIKDRFGDEAICFGRAA